MKTGLAILACLAAAAAASAEIRVFFTKVTIAGGAPGLTIPGNAFKPSTAITSDDNIPNPGDGLDNNADAYSGAFAVAYNNFPVYSTAVPTKEV